MRGGCQFRMVARAVVMLMTPPRSTRELAVGLISTVITQIGGGAIARPVFPLAGVGRFGDRARGAGRLDLRLRPTRVGDRALGLQLHRAKP
jgi:hypothetical protein